MRISPVPPAIADNGICGEVGGPDFFSSDPTEVRVAKNLCSGCPVRLSCIEWALGNNEAYGVWGGADQWEIRIALSIDQLGRPAKRPRRAKCPFCRTAKNVTEARDLRSRSSVANCALCGLTWRRARSYVKKERTALSDAA